MKKILLFGATGTIGRHVLSQLGDTENEVTVFCRDASRLETPSTLRYRIIEGDVLNRGAVEAAIAGQDIVIVTLGSGKARRGTVRSEGTKNIIAGMIAQGVKRLICQTTLGAGESNANLNFFWKRIMFGWFLKEVFLDHELQEKYVKSSGLDWTIVRPAAFTDGDMTGSYRHGFGPEEKNLTLKISREDVAAFLVKQISSAAYLRQTPGLSY